MNKKRKTWTTELKKRCWRKRNENKHDQAKGIFLLYWLRKKPLLDFLKKRTLKAIVHIY